MSAISSTKADAQGLFAVPLDRITTTAREVDPGDPTSLPVSPYWFGEALGNHSAVTAVEHETRLTEALRAEGWSERDATEDYIVFYELSAADGRSSALPDQNQPAGEIQVSSQPITLPAAQGAIDAANGRNGDLRYKPWPRSTVRLRSGEKAVVIPDASARPWPRGGGEGAAPGHAGGRSRTTWSCCTRWRAGSSALSADGKRLKPREVVAEFDNYLHDELDLVREAANAAQLRRNMAGLHLVLIPEMVLGLVHARR